MSQQRHWWRLFSLTRPRHPTRARPHQVALGALAALLLALPACATPTIQRGPRSTASVPPHGDGATPTGAPAPTSPGALVSAAPPATPYPDTTPQIAATVTWYLNHLTLAEKLGQMIQVETYYQTYSPDIASMLTQQHVGSVIIYGKNMQTPAQLAAYTAALQAHASIPLFITMDEEGGNVDRLGYSHFDPALPSAQAIGASGDPALAYQAGTAAAAEMQAFGINVDLAPVVDVRQTPYAIEGPRLYGSDPQTVDTYAGQFLLGLEQHGEIAVLKHWPGIGSLTLDPHLTLPTLSGSTSQLAALDWSAFRGMLPLDPGMIMVTHVLVPAVDPTLPATLSPKLVQGILRDQLGYQGVIITDNLYMKGISDHYSLGQAAVLSVLAGDDILAGGWDSQSTAFMLSSLESAVASGQISQARVDLSLRRILTLKALYGLLPLIPAWQLPGANHYAPGVGASADAPRG